MVGEGLDNQTAVEGDIVVAKDGVAKGRGEGGEDLGATADCVAAGDEGEGAVGDEVAGDENEVWSESVDFVDDALEEEGFGVLVEVDVAELDDAIAVEGVGEICDRDGSLDDVDFVACDLGGVEGQPCGGNAGSDEEVSSGETGRQRGGGTGHMQ